MELGRAENPTADRYKIYLDSYARDLDLKRFSADTKLEVGYDSQIKQQPVLIKFTQEFRTTPRDGKFLIGYKVSFSKFCKLASFLIFKYFFRAH